MGKDFQYNVNLKTHGKKTIDALEKQINNLKNNTVHLKVCIDGKSEISNILKQIQLAQKQTLNFKIVTDSSNYNKTVNTTKKDFQILKNLANEINQKKIRIAGLDGSKNNNQISTLQLQLQKLESDYCSLSTTLRENLNVTQVGQLTSIFEKSSNKINEINAKAKDLANNISTTVKPFQQMDAVNASNKTLTWLKNNCKAAKNYGETLNILAEKQKTSSSQEELGNYTNQIDSIKSEASSKGLTGVSISDNFKKTIGQIAHFTNIYGFIQNMAFQVPRDMLQAVKDVDTAMATLYKSTDETANKYKEFLTNAGKTSKSLGRDMSSYITQTSQWAKLGYNLSDSEELSKLSSVYSNVGNEIGRAHV